MRFLNKILLYIAREFRFVPPVLLRFSESFLFVGLLFAANPAHAGRFYAVDPLHPTPIPVVWNETGSPDGEQHEKVTDHMTSENLITIQESDTISHAQEKLIKGHIQLLPVVDSLGRLVGIVTQKDIAESLVKFHTNEQDLKEFLNTEVKQVMKTTIFCCSPDTDVNEVACIMKSRHLSAVPVINPNGALLGIISKSDLLGVVTDSSPKYKTLARIFEAFLEISTSLTQPRG